MARSKRMPRKLSYEPLEPRHAMAVGLLASLPDLSLPAAAADRTIDLATHFDDTSVTGTVVGVQTNLTAPFDRVFFELFDRAGPGRTRTTPVTAANFLNYATSNRYDNTFVHRSVPGFVIQGGGFKLANGLPHIDTFSPIVNEFGTSNTRGTIAMAKLGQDAPGGGPDSATSEWFVNLADNSANLDTQNGGFTVFGRVLGSGMNLFDGIASLPRYDIRQAFANGALNETPLLGAPATLPDNFQFSVSNFVFFSSIDPVSELVYTVTSSNPSVVAASVDAEGRLNLRLPRGGAGTSVITVRATSVFNSSDTVEDSFNVQRAAPSSPNGVMGLGGGTNVWLGASTGSQFTSEVLATLPAGPWSNFLTGDFNDDGRDDFAARSAAGEWWVGLTPATGTATPAAWGSWPFGPSWQNVVAGDFNGDGRTDIAGRNPADGSWVVSRSTGLAFTTSLFGTWSPTTEWVSVVTGDFDGDGKTDIAGRNAVQGGWRVSRSTGTAFVNLQFGPWNPSISWLDVVTGDFDGDGKTDIAGRNAATGHWNVSRSTGTAFVTSRFGFWTADVAWATVVAGDFDGDGKSDIAGRNTSNGAWRVARSNGTRFTTLAFSTWPKTVSYTGVGGVRI